MRWVRVLVRVGLVAVVLVAGAPPAGAADAAAPPSVVIRGDATVDGRRSSARFLGAVVVDHGLSTACQAAIPTARPQVVQPSQAGTGVSPITVMLRASTHSPQAGHASSGWTISPHSWRSSIGGSSPSSSQRSPNRSSDTMTG